MLGLNGNQSGGAYSDLSDGRSSTSLHRCLSARGIAIETVKHAQYRHRGKAKQPAGGPTALRRSGFVLCDAQQHQFEHRTIARANHRRLVRRHGYPPDKQEVATDLVIDKAELLGAEWAA